MKQRQEAACTAPYFWLVLNLLESEHQHVNIFLLIAVWPFPEYVSADGVHAGPKEILHLLIGLAPFFWKYAHFLALTTISSALHTGSRKADLTLTSKRAHFVWGRRQQQAFKLQLCLTKAPVLAQPNPDAPCKVVCVLHAALAAVNAESEANRLSQVQAMRC